MGRLFIYVAILVLAVFVLSAAFILRHGGSSSEAVTQVSVHDLAAATERYVDQRVTTQGVLHRIDDPEEHFVLEADHLRVAIIGYDRDALLDLDGQPVMVTGRFDFEEGTGRFIRADSVAAAP